MAKERQPQLLGREEAGGTQRGARHPVHAVSDEAIQEVQELYAQRGMEISESDTREVLRQSLYFFYQLWLSHEEWLAEGEAGQDGAEGAGGEPGPATLGV
jgi:hypothetical protein